MRNSLALAIVILLASATTAWAIPKLDEPVPLPAGFEGIITVYPDSENTKAIQNFWEVPSTARIARKPDGKLAFGLVHSGISSFDPDGINALITMTVQPYIDIANKTKVEKLISAEVEKAGGAAHFRFISPTETQVFFLVGGQFVDWEGKKPDAIIKGGAVESGMPFQLKISNSFDVRAISQAGGSDADTLGVLYRMKFDGTRKRCHFLITAGFKETYEHFKAAVSASGWFGLARASSALEIQKLESKDAIKIQLYECTRQDFDKYYPTEAVDGLMSALAARTGAFARTLKANGLPDAPGGGGQWGWSLSAGGGFEKYDETRTIEYEYDLNFTEEQEIEFGMTFPSGGAELKTYVKNITDTKKPYPTSDDFKAIRAQHTECRKNNIESLKTLLDAGKINQIQYDKYSDKALNEGCNVDYTTKKLFKLLGLKQTVGFKLHEGEAPDFISQVLELQ